MANAIITDDFRRNQVELFIDNVTSENNAEDQGYFIGIGRSNPWNSTETPPIPNGSELEKKDAMANLIALARIEDAAICRLLPKTNQLWTAGLKFKRYDTTDPTCFNVDSAAGLRGCYAYLNDKLYLCLGNGSADGSTIATTANQPASTTVGVPNGDGADGYVWVLIGDFIANSEFKESTTFFEIPLPVVKNDSGTNDSTNARKGSAGLLYGFRIIDAGAGYTANLTGATAATALLRFTRLDNSIGTANLKITTNASGQVSGVLDGTGNAFTLADSISIGVGDSVTGAATGAGGIGIKHANVQITGAGNPTSTAIVEPLIAPALGFGVQDQTDTKSTDTTGIQDVFPPFYLGLTYEFEQNTTGDTFVDITFRQITVVKNATRTADSGDSSITTLDALKHLTTSTNLSGIIPSAGSTTSGWYMKNTSTGEQAWIDKIVNNSGTYEIYYHQNSNSTRTSAGLFNGSTQDIIPNSGTVAIYDNSDVVKAASVTISGRVNAEHDSETGQILFLENRAPVTRTSAQKENVRIILQF